MKAGSYYIGDPCHAVTHKTWIEMVDTVWLQNERSGGLREFRGESIFVCSTAHGDGCYPAGPDYFIEIGVDSGAIGCLPVSLVEEKDVHGYHVTFHYDFECSYENGVFTFGNITIDTN